MMPLVTVAVAAYNVENFIENGMQYVLHQTYPNLEIIIVDDGSTDSTPKLCDTIAQTDSRVKVFHKENGGLGSARNVGIDNANGEFVYFFDVDDSIDLDLIEKNMGNATKYDVDMIIFGYYAKLQNEVEEEKISLTEHLVQSNEELKKIYCDELLWMKHGNGFAWNKFYRKSFLNKYHFRFGEQRIQQDEPFNMQLYQKLDRVYISPECYYHYIIYNQGNAGSRYLMNKEKIIIDVYNSFMTFYNQWIIDDSRVLAYINNRFISGMLTTAGVNYYHEDCALSKKEKKNRLRELINNESLRKVRSSYQLSGEENILNKLIISSFLQGKLSCFMFAVECKRKLRKLMKRSL